MKKLFSAFALAALTLSACSAQTEEADILVEGVPQEFIPEASPSFEGTLLQAQLTSSDSEEILGSAMLTSGGGYSYISANAILPELEEGFFYEGWLLRNEPLNVISTGALTPSLVVDGTLDFRNNEELEGDYSDHLQYIITLEPDDGDPAPAAHIAEGTLTSL